MNGTSFSINLGSCAILFLLTLASSSIAQSRFEQCLPKDISKSDRVVGESKMTVAENLKKLRARCRNGKLVDRRRREIKIVKIECWGNPPANYLEIIRQRNEEIARLKKKHIVIEVACTLNIPTP